MSTMRHLLQPDWVHLSSCQFFKKLVNLEAPQNWCLQAGISCPQAHPSLADGQKKFVKYSVSKICHSRAGEAQEWQLVDSSHFSSTVCCQEIVHVLTASSVCLPPEYTGEKISLVCEQISDKSSKQCHQHFFCLQYQSSARNLFWDLGFFFSFATKKLKEVSQSCTKKNHIFKFMLVVLTKTIDCDKKYFQKHKVCLWQRIECRQRLCFSSFRPR